MTTHTPETPARELSTEARHEAARWWLAVAVADALIRHPELDSFDVDATSGFPEGTGDHPARLDLAVGYDRDGRMSKLQITAPPALYSAFQDEDEWPWDQFITLDAPHGNYSIARVIEWANQKVA